jgi:hypothetical protein
MLANKKKERKRKKKKVHRNDGVDNKGWYTADGHRK